MLNNAFNVELLAQFGIDLADETTITQERVDNLVKYLLEEEAEELATPEILVFDYSAKSLNLAYTLNNGFDDNINVSRCVIINEYLYFVGNIFVKSYDMQNDFALVEELRVAPLTE